jgi:hypothetical protein
MVTVGAEAGLTLLAIIPFTLMMSQGHQPQPMYL